MLDVDSMDTETIESDRANKHFHCHGEDFYFAEYSLFLFSNASKLRILLVRLITWKYFEYFITAMIVANSVLLGMMDYTDTDNKSWRNKMVQRSETVFTVIFTLEATCKIIGMGFIAEKGCYLRNAWNWLDFIVVITSLLETLPGMSNISGLRTFRLFRPLRNLTTVPSMRTLVGTLLQSMAQLGGILSLAIFFFMIFAILGVNLWAGKIHQRCWGLTLGENGEYANNWDQLDTERGLCRSDSQCGINAVCDSYRQYLHDEGLSAKGYSVTNVEDLNWGITNFDNIWSAFLTIFQCITMEGWTPIMYIYMDAYSSSIVIIYYISCIVTCSLFLLNLTVAVMLSQYEELDKNEGSKDFGELQEQAKKAKLPKRLIKFILENDMVLKKPKKRDEDENFSSIFQRIKTSLTSTTPVPEEKYYQAPIVKICFMITVHPIFQTFIMTIIVANTVILAMDKYPEHPSKTQAILDQINLVFTVLFTVEVVVKAVGLGLKQFMKEGFNIFDLVIVIISLLEISLSDGGGSFSALRAFRLFRIFKLFRVGDLRVLIDSIAFTITTIGNYTVLLILFIYVYSLLGMQFFAGKLKFDEDGLPDSNGTSPRANFDTLTWSSLTIFQILIGDNWNTVMYDCIRTAGPLASLYFITLILMGNIVMLNLFLAILLGNFDRARLFHMKSKIIEAFNDCMVKDNYSIEKALRVVFPDIPQHMRDFLLNKKRKGISIAHLAGSNVSSMVKAAQVSKNHHSSLSQAPAKFQTSNLISPAGMPQDRMQSIESVNLSNAEKEAENISCKDRFLTFFKYKSLFIFDKTSWIRQKCLIMVNKNDDEEEEIAQKLSVQATGSQSNKTEPLLYNPEYWRGKKISKIFDNFILVLILLSSFSLALQNPLDDPNSTYSKILYYIDVVFTLLFFLECSIKIIALGFLFCNLEEEGREAYLRSAWNMLDFIVVAASMTDLMFRVSGNSSGGALKSLKALRVLRALRPLRVIGRNEGLRLVVNALLSSIPAMTNVLMVCLLFLMIFAIMGINFFKGQFYSCIGLSDELIGGIKTKDDCQELGGRWNNARSNFDDIFSAMLSLFEMMTTEGWLTVMWNGVDSRGIDKQPEKNSKTYATIFFMGYMIIGSQFILNLFVGIVIDNFNKIKEKELGNVFLTEAQKEWMELQRLVLSCQLLVQPVPPKNKYRLWCYNLVNKRGFELFITSCIFGNTIIMAIKYYLMPQNLIDTIEIINYIFAVIFNIEAIIKLIALGKKYFQDNWNLFDFFVVVGTDLGIIVTLSLSGVNVSSAASIVRAFRIMRLFVLIRSAKSIKLIIDTVVRLLPQITNIMSLVLLLFFIYAALGINLFSGVKYNGEINEKNNFRTLGSSFLLLMRCATGEDWNLIMSDLAQQKSDSFDCVSNQSYESQQENGINGCGTEFAYFYFLTFILLINMLIMNLTIAAVIEGLNTVTGQNSGLVTKENVESLLEVWMHYDPEARGFIKQDELIFFFMEVPKPFQIESQERGEVYNKNWLKRRNRSFKKEQLMERNGIQISSFDALKILKQVEVPVYEGDKVHFKDVYKKLVKQIFRKNQEKRKQKRMIDQLGQSVVIKPEEEEREEDLDDYKLSFKIKQRMKKEWHKRFKVLKKANKNKELSVTKLHALQIIRKFIDKKKAQRQRHQSEPNQTLGGIKTMIANESQESEAVSQNLNDTVLNQDSKESQRRLHQPTDQSKKLTISDRYDDFAIEMEQALALNQKEWKEEEKEEEKAQVIPELEFGQNPELWKTQNNFGNFKSPLKEKIRLQKPLLMDLQTREKPGETISPNAAFVPRIQSRHSIQRPLPTDQDISNDSFFEKQNHEVLVKELEDMQEDEIIDYLDKSKDLKDSLVDRTTAKKKKDLLIVDEVSENREASRIQPYSSLISRNQGVKTEQTNKKLVISFDKQSH